jgi:hypothetical protein
MVSLEGRVFGRLGNRQALNRAYQQPDLLPKGRDEEGFKFPMQCVRGHDQYCPLSAAPRIFVGPSAVIAIRSTNFERGERYEHHQ